MIQTHHLKAASIKEVEVLFHSTPHPQIPNPQLYTETVLWHWPFPKINFEKENHLLKSFAAGFWTTYENNTEGEKINPYGSIRRSIINVHLKDL